MAEGAVARLTDWARLAPFPTRWRGGMAVPRGLALPAAAAPPAWLRAGGAALDGWGVRQWLFGRGYILPGDADFIRDLLRPSRLGAGLSLLDVAAGLGGPVRSVAQALGIAASGIERDPELASRGAIDAYDPESIENLPQPVDVVLGREALFAVRDKERFLRVVFLGLKPRGALVLTDFILDRVAGERPELAAWARALPYSPALWTQRQYVDCLGSLGFAVPETEDITALYRYQILAAWQVLLQAEGLRRLPRGQMAAVVEEAEHWRRVVAALDSGALRMIRLVAMR